MKRNYITEEKYIINQYGTDKNLLNRQQIYTFNTNQTPWFYWVFDLLGLKDKMKVLEIGSGNGRLWIDNMNRIPGDIEITLSDISRGMINKIN